MSHRLKIKSSFIKKMLSLLLALQISLPVQLLAEQGEEKWEYNPGPDPQTKAGRELVDLYAELPEYMVMSEELMDEQKFRYTFGLMLTRTSFDPNAVKILFVGQDATHIAEAAKQPGTSGFGARVQSIGNYFGVDQSIATTNAFLSTIKGQYGALNHPVIEKNDRGVEVIRMMPYVDNEFWLMANGKESEIVIKREEFWEWMIKNNPESMRLFILFGGAARDAFAEFLIARGAKVQAKLTDEKLKKLRVPETKMENAGGNNEVAVPIDKEGRDIYQLLVNEKDAKKKLDYSDPNDMKLALDTFREAGARAISMMVFTDGGLYGSGVLNAAQLGGYDLESVEINGVKTNSLKGLKLSDGTLVQENIAFTMSQHPSSLSRLTPEQASRALKESFTRLNKLKEETGWFIEPDQDSYGKKMRNRWSEGLDYEYGRADIRQGYFEFGAPEDRRVSRADASRLDKQTIVAGTREKAKFDYQTVKKAKWSQPSSPKSADDLWSVRQRSLAERYVFDRGPGNEIAKLMMNTIDRSLLFKPKADKTKIDSKGNDKSFETYGIDAFNTKTHPGTGLFGFHRGSFETSKVLILADPHGIDDWLTSRALTGARGQYLNGLMNDLGFKDDYLVLKTVPVGMDGATAEEWEYVRKNTELYREAIIKKALENKNIEMVFTDGEVAQKEMYRILSKLKINNLKVVALQRKEMDPSIDINQVKLELKKQGLQEMATVITGKAKDIPRAHLTWWSRIWEGTGGVDFVVDATDSNRGGVRAVIAPNWVAQQQVHAQERVRISIEKIIKIIQDAGLRVSGKETIQQFVARRASELLAGKTGVSISEATSNIKTLVNRNVGRIATCLSYYQKASPVTK
ncbi:MAG: hypothetical protein HUU56_05470 [Bdellovibrionaceae bacterium]|nr:hypothetical protein [Pseudobdellovibrionaceae bacterium]